LTPAAVIELQRCVGNRAAGRLVQRRVLQREKICVPGACRNSPECREWERVQPEIEAARKRKRRSDLKPAADAFHGVAPFYLVTDQLRRDAVVDPDYNFNFSDWLIVPYLIRQDDQPHWDRPAGPVVYYVAWSPEAKRNELVIGPNELESFLGHEQAAKELRNLSYFLVPYADEWGNGQPSADAVYLAKPFVALEREGDVGKALKLWGQAWIMQAKNPMTWVNVLIAYAGSVGKPGAGGGPAAESRAPAVTAPPVEAVEHPVAPGAAEHPPGAVTAVPKPSVPAEPRVALPNGTSIPPDSYSGGFYGTTEPTRGRHEGRPSGTRL
jgi:hypothetical protein